MPKTEYKTRQRELITELFINNPNRQFSANDTAEIMNGKIGKSTVYREISRLCDEGFLRKYPGSDGLTMYQLSGKDCHGHFHLKCTNCGKIVHLDCLMMNDICSHITFHHGFDIDISKTMLFGICEDCK